MKLRHFNLISHDKVPDHILEEANQVAVKIGKSIEDLMHQTPPNIFMAAFNYVHSAVINNLVVDDNDSKMRCVDLEAQAMKENIKVLSRNKKT